MRRRSPLIRFLAAGGVLFLFTRALVSGGDPVDRSIRVPPSRIDSSELDLWLTEEILVREALARGLEHDAVVERRLGRNLAFIEADTTPRRARERLRQSLLHTDPVVRRRLAQSMRAVLESDTDPDPPAPAEIRAYLERHPDEFAFPGAVEIEQVFFDRTLRPRAQQEAEAQARNLRAGGLPPPVAVGDPPPVRGSGLRAPATLAKYYGSSFADAVMALPPATWGGPLPSPFGFHVVRVVRRELPRPANLDEARARVVAAILAERREAAFDRGLRQMRQHYIVRDRPTR